MTKSKSSTIAIVVLSVLLAAALASTIVLAAFNQSKTASTTISFGQGITLVISGTSLGSDSTPDTADNTAALKWTATVGSTSDYDGSVDASDGSETISLAKIGITATGPENSVFVAVKPSVTYSGNGTGSVTLSLGTNWRDLGNGWYIYSTATQGTGSSNAYQQSDATAFPLSTETDVTTDVTTIFNPGSDTANDFAGRTYTCSIDVQAVSDVTAFSLS